jgi:hypothetical protein
MIIYTYYDASVGINTQAELIRQWELSWARRGWEPRILTPRNAAQHPFYREFVSHINRLPTVNPRKYENACYLRWLALDAAGGGWMSDYDVINFAMAPHTRAFPFEIPERNYVPCVSFSTAAGARRPIQLILEYPTNKVLWPAQDGHVSDMLIFQNRLINGMDLGKSEVGAVVREYHEADWMDFPLTHFSAGVTRQAGHSTKIQAIFNCGRPL